VSEIDVVWLIDLDPPSDVGGGKGFYPASSRTDPPDETLMRKRCDAALELVTSLAGGKAVVTVHTSPRHRTALLEGIYPEIWSQFLASGAALALHPHEEREDRSTLYDDPAHMADVITRTIALGRARGITFETFRSGTFSFNPALPRILADAGIHIDLSAAPTLRDPHRSIDWPAKSAEPDVFRRDGIDVVEIPIGWDGSGSSVDENYLFSERMDLKGLIRVWDALRARAATAGAPLLVNYLCHGFGLVDPAWRRQASDFIAHIGSHGGRLVGADAARRRLEQKPPRGNGHDDSGDRTRVVLR